MTAGAADPRPAAKRGPLNPLLTGSGEYPFVTLDWARQWPCEEVWKVRKRT